ncbi:hypothetical protein [Nonomuraea rhizosphaerae]|uniref:hypothetical protein n=1 Tax=Nonomuraea rhizosphaerae TaxID=2665663 RepID=UPI001C5F9674|nr:hypothetical protein [Nonomuraea rhizosphaerae]
MRIEPAALLDGAKACEEVGALVQPAVETFRTSAAPTDDCFGLVERGADELATSYRAFYDELLAFADDLTAKLGETAVGLRESATRLGNG